MANPLSMPLPHLVHPASLSLDSAPAALKYWATTLDLKDLGGATRQLYEQLRLTNRAEMPARLRLDWLESLVGMVKTITEGLRAHYQNKPFPLSDTEMAVAQLANALHGEMILGYRHILATPPDTSLLGRSSERQMRQIACYRLFVHAGEILNNYQAMYSDPPAGMWRHLHAYYGRVRRQGWANVPVPGTPPQTSIEMEYRKTLLLALQPSQQVPFGEWQKIKQNIDEWVPLAPLLDARNRPVDRPLYCIRFELDMPMAAATDQCCGACDSHTVGVLLDTKPLIAALEERLEFWNTERASSSGDGHEPAMESLKMLLRSWRIPESPRALRVPADVPLSIVSGLENIHAVLSGESHRNQQGRSPNKSQLISAVTRDPLGEKQHKVYFSAIPEGIYPGVFESEGEVVEINYSGWESALPSPWRIPPRERKVEPLPAKAVNVSNAGYRLEMVLPEKNTIRLGELIVLRGARGESWELFVLRWVRRIGGERATLGLERIGDGLHAIDIIVQGSDETRGVLHALTVFDEEMNTIVVMPQLPSLGKKRLTIRHGETETPITLVGNLTLSRLFESFVFKLKDVVERGKRTKESDKSMVKMNSPDPFSAIWGVL